MAFRLPPPGLAEEWESKLAEYDDLLDPAKLDQQIRSNCQLPSDGEEADDEETGLRPGRGVRRREVEWFIGQVEEVSQYYRAAPALVDRFAEDRPLSKRERQILDLHTDGISKRQIRERLMCDRNLVIALTRDFDRFAKASGLNPPCRYPRKAL